MPHLSRDEFKEQLLQVMESKIHWAWPSFGSGQVAAALLHIHFEQEYESYVRDFPVMVGWAYVQCPVAQVRAELAENLFEEETGQLVAGRPHPQLFLEYPRGLGMDMRRFESIELLPKAAEYRACLDKHCHNRGWEIAAAVATIFIEGTAYERGELDPSSPRRPVPPLEEHPLVKHYGLPLEHLALTKAHRQVEGDHRQAAWRCLLDYSRPEMREQAVAAVRECREAWVAYRSEVALACGLKQAT